MENYKGVESKWEFNKTEKGFINCCIKSGYEIVECKQYISKTKWKVRIGDAVIPWETLNNGIKFAEKPFQKNIEMSIKLAELKRSLEN